MNNNIIKLKPYFKDYIWGGNKLKEYGKISDGIIAESWELSTHPDGVSVVDSGFDKGLNLRDFIKKNPETIGNKKDIPILIKYIDSNNDLSIQVHPNDEYALKHENQLGKTEAWYVIESENDSFIYYGLKKDLTKEELQKKLLDGTITEVLNKVYTKPGDCFLIEPGTIHAIGSGNLICEIQECSNVTYRIFDYYRKDKNGNMRELHISNALDVISLNKLDLNNRNLYKGNCQYFKSNLYSINNKTTFSTEKNYDIICIIKGEGKINDLNIKKGDTYFVPYGYGEYQIEGNCSFVRITPSIN